MKLCLPSALLLLLFLWSVSAGQIQVHLSDNPTTCSPMTISWDTLQGISPWTIIIAPTNHNPISIQLDLLVPPASIQQWSWQIPAYISVDQLIVAVSDSTGSFTGTSSFVNLNNNKEATIKCSQEPINEKLDFIWLTSNQNPRQCFAWPILFQEENDNSGMIGPLDLMILPENSIPTRLQIKSNDISAYDWTVNYPQETRFTIAAFDHGKNRNGGVGDIYKVKAGISNVCLNVSLREMVSGFPPAMTTVASTPTATRSVTVSSSSSSKMMTVKTSPSNSTPSTAKTGSNLPFKQSETSKGTIVGGVVGGIVAALALAAGLGFLFIRYRRRKEQLRRNGDPFADDFAKQHPKPVYSLFVNESDSESMLEGVRRSPRSTRRRSEAGANPDIPASDLTGFVDKNRNMMGHASSVSLHRGRDSFGGSIANSNNNIIHSTVPDEDLVPPPLPMNKSPRLDTFSPSSNVNHLLRSTSNTSEMDYNHHHQRETESELSVFVIKAPTTSSFHPNDSIPTMRILPPTPATTSLFDPYVHMSQLYDQDEAERISSLVNHNHPFSTTTSAVSTLPQEDSACTNVEPGIASPHRYADPKQGEARLRNLENQLIHDRKRVVSCDSSSSLPYI